MRNYNIRKQELQTKTEVMVSTGVGTIILTAYTLLVIASAILLGLFR